MRDVQRIVCTRDRMQICEQFFSDRLSSSSRTLSATVFLFSSVNENTFLIKLTVKSRAARGERRNGSIAKKRRRRGRRSSTGARDKRDPTEPPRFPRLPPQAKHKL